MDDYIIRGNGLKNYDYVIKDLRYFQIKGQSNNPKDTKDNQVIQKT